VKHKILHAIFVLLVMTPLLVPYRNNIVHDKYLFCSQKLKNEKIQESLSAVHRKMETLAMQVSKQQAVMSSTQVILKMIQFHVPCHIRTVNSQMYFGLMQICFHV
jgi:hypothetical protein